MKWALNTMALLEGDREILTYRIYRGKLCIDEFEGTKAEWFDHILSRHTESKGGPIH